MRRDKFIKGCLRENLDYFSKIIGCFISNKYNRLAVIASERYDIIMILYKILKKVINRIEKLYTKAIKAQGNLKAIATIHNIFEIDERNWHGLGQIRRSGLKLKKGYSSLATKKELEIKRRHQK